VLLLYVENEREAGKNMARKLAPRNYSSKRLFGGLPQRILTAKASQRYAFQRVAKLARQLLTTANACKRGMVATAEHIDRVGRYSP